MSGYVNFKLKMTELLWDVQLSKKFGEPKCETEYTEGEFTTYVTILIDGNSGTAQFASDKKTSLSEAIENSTRKAIDSCTSTYRSNIIDYTYETLEKLHMKYMAIELANSRLEESNKVLLKSLSLAQEDNWRY